MTVGITELPPEGMQLPGVALAGDADRGTKTTEGISLLFTTAGITVQGPQPQIERLLVWTALDSATCRESRAAGRRPRRRHHGADLRRPVDPLPPPERHRLARARPPISTRPCRPGWPGTRARRPRPSPGRPRPRRSRRPPTRGRRHAARPGPAGRTPTQARPRVAASQRRPGRGRRQPVHGSTVTAAAAAAGLRRAAAGTPPDGPARSRPHLGAAAHRGPAAATMQAPPAAPRPARRRHLRPLRTRTRHRRPPPPAPTVRRHPLRPLPRSGGTSLPAPSARLAGHRRCGAHRARRRPRPPASRAPPMAPPAAHRAGAPAGPDDARPEATGSAAAAPRPRSRPPPRTRQPVRRPTPRRPPTAAPPASAADADPWAPPRPSMAALARAGAPAQAAPRKQQRRGGRAADGAAAPPGDVAPERARPPATAPGRPRRTARGQARTAGEAAGFGRRGASTAHRRRRRPDRRPSAPPRPRPRAAAPAAPPADGPRRPCAAGAPGRPGPARRPAAGTASRHRRCRPSAPLGAPPPPLPGRAGGDAGAGVVLADVRAKSIRAAGVALVVAPRPGGGRRCRLRGHRRSSDHRRRPRRPPPCPGRRRPPPTRRWPASINLRLADLPTGWTQAPPAQAVVRPPVAPAAAQAAAANTMASCLDTSYAVVSGPVRLRLAARPDQPGPVADLPERGGHVVRDGLEDDDPDARAGEVQALDARLHRPEVRPLLPAVPESPGRGRRPRRHGHGAAGHPGRTGRACSPTAW